MMYQSSGYDEENNDGNDIMEIGCLIFFFLIIPVLFWWLII